MSAGYSRRGGGRRRRPAADRLEQLGTAGHACSPRLPPRSAARVARGPGDTGNRAAPGTLPLANPRRRGGPDVRRVCPRRPAVEGEPARGAIHADLAWFGLALIGSALTYVASSLNLVAFVPQRVSIIRGALVELSGAFIGLVTPPTVGHLAVNARYLSRQGVDGVTTATAVALSQVVNLLTTITLLVVAVLITGSGGPKLKVVPGPRLLAVLGGLIVILVVLLTAVRPTKELFFKRVWPRIRGVWPQLLEVLSQPVRLVEGVGGNILLTGSYVLALIASLHAVGAHPPIIATAAVFMAGNAVGSAAPTPGGIGAIEAVMTAGLTAIGVPAHDAVPGVLIFRVATFYLPILPGWVLSVVLARRGIL